MPLNTLASRTSIVALIFGLLAVAGGTTAARSQLPVRYSATATNLDPSVLLTATFVDITVTRWSTDNERAKLLGVLFESGQDKLLRTLHDMPSAGTIKTPDTLAYDLRYAQRIPGQDGGERIVLATDRYIGFWEAASLARTLEYPFTVIELRLNSQGRGEGKITVATKLTADEETGQIVLENYGSLPVQLSNVKRENR